MRISIIICDHCGHEILGGSFETYRVGEGPWLDICESCQDKPFKKDRQPHPRGKAIAEAVRVVMQPEPRGRSRTAAS